jgi:hypothetical protein
VYAFDPERRELVVVWPATAGSLAHVVAEFGATVAEGDAGALCAALSRLSDALWDIYVRPASATDDEDEHARREDERQRFDGVVAAVRGPNLPDESGVLIVSYSLVEESAHRLGRVLHRLADAGLVDAVVADLEVEIDAVTRAELGDLSGRAVQAVPLDRLDVSPVQVAAADELLRADPLGAQLLAVAVDPAAACVAAAHWLAAAAVVAADAAGNEPGEVFMEADDIQPVSIEVPTLMVERILDEDLSPREVVLDLLRSAVAAGEGKIADLPGVLAQRGRVEELVGRLPGERRDEVLAKEPVRATLLDPRRPARDLLEHLLDGIASCHLFYDEYADDENADDENVDLDMDADGEHGSADDPEDQDSEDGGDVVAADIDRDDGRYDVAAGARRREEIADAFAALVRQQAAATHARLI